MDIPQGTNAAFGTPLPPMWARSDKNCIGTAFSAESNLWFSIAKGIVTEVYYPTIDLPQIRDLQFLVTDGATFFHDERRGFDNAYTTLAPGALGYTVTNTSHPTPGGQTYTLVKQVITSPRAPCLLVHTKIEAPQPLRGALKLYALLAPHLNNSGYHNFGWVADGPLGKMLVARRVSKVDGSDASERETWLALAVSANAPFLQCSCGIVGATDGWQDLHGSSIPGNRPFVMDWSFDSAIDSNIALTAQIDISRTDEFVLALGFGETLNSAAQRARQALASHFQSSADGKSHSNEFVSEWAHAHMNMVKPRPGVTGDGDMLYTMSRAILMAHEDKTYDGALIASLSIPWGDASPDDDLGYHLVWTRDMCNSASALLASGETETPLRALMFLATVQREDGSFYQNFHVNGSPYRTSVQLDEIAFPIIFAWRLNQHGALQAFDPYPMVKRAAVALVLNGPMTQQERWEESEGYSPSTLAACIGALVCAADMAHERGDAALEQFWLEYADFFESHLEAWTVAADCRFLPNTRHFVRILPTYVKGDDRRRGPTGVPALPVADGDPNSIWVTVGNRGGLQMMARDLLDPGFLELVRYGIRHANDPLIVDSLRCVDAPGAAIKVDFTAPGRSGPGWHRYNEDGYGNYADGRPYDGGGRGGTWPLLTGERGHYELAAGRDPRPYVKTMEGFAETGLLSEQLWDLPDLQHHPHFKYSYPSGAAMPLAWAHAEYIKLVRSASDGEVFDRIKPVADRYLRANKPSSNIEVWNFYRQIAAIGQSAVLRIVLGWPFRLHWSSDGWEHPQDTDSTSPAPGLFYVDLPPLPKGGLLVFTFFWPALGQWQQVNYSVSVP